MPPDNGSAKPFKPAWASAISENLPIQHPGSRNAGLAENWGVRCGSWPCKNGVERSVLGQNTSALQASIAAISGLTPMMFMTRVRL